MLNGITASRPARTYRSETVSAADAEVRRRVTPLIGELSVPSFTSTLATSTDQLALQQAVVGAAARPVQVEPAAAACRCHEVLSLPRRRSTSTATTFPTRTAAARRGSTFICGFHATRLRCADTRVAAMRNARPRQRIHRGAAGLLGRTGVPLSSGRAMPRSFSDSFSSRVRQQSRLR